MATNEVYEGLLTSLKGVSDAAQGTAKIVQSVGWRRLRPSLVAELLQEMEASMDDARKRLTFWAESGTEQTSMEDAPTTDADTERLGDSTVHYSTGWEVKQAMRSVNATTGEVIT